MTFVALYEDLNYDACENLSGGVRKYGIEVQNGQVKKQTSDEKAFGKSFKGTGGQCFIRNYLEPGTIIYPDDPNEYPIFVSPKPS
ncbi:MAG: hypothetical protein KME40_32575 [Komarekiella atlantica HA4396-MV6]|jgi:hypothetical protein|nr:hypothetical protein [Komarekiella atlantica HA4396-MV6]